MRLVSRQIQSVNYDPSAFLIDLEAFAASVRRVDGMEGDRVQEFEALVERAVRDIKLSCNNVTEGENDSLPANSRGKGSNKLTKVAASESSENSIAADKKTKLENGIADLFQSAMDAIAATGISETEPLSSSGRGGAAEVSSDRVSALFRSLFEHGSQHGAELAAVCRKRKARVAKAQADALSGTSSVSTLQQKKLQQKGSHLTPKNSPKLKLKEKEKAAPAPISLQPTLSQSQELPIIAGKANVQAIGAKRGRADDSQVNSKTTALQKKKIKLATPTTGYMPEWLVVDSTRGDISCLSNSLSSGLIQSQVSPPPDKVVRGAFDPREGSDISGRPVSAGQSRLAGVYPLLAAGSSTNIVHYSARVELLGRDVDLGLFPSEEAAARAHDRALMRAIGPSNCRACDLNFPVTEYSCDALIRFMEFDEKLKAQLFVTAWNGLKPCDFGFLLMRGVGQGPAVLQTQATKMSQFAPGAVKTAVLGDSKNLRTLPTQDLSKTNDKAQASGTGSSSLLPPVSSTSSSSLKSRIVMDGEIERGRVPPAPIGAIVTVANAPSATPSNVSK